MTSKIHRGSGRRKPLVHAAPKKLDEVRNEINVELPKARNANEKRDLGEQPIVSLVRDGASVKYYFAQDYVGDIDGVKKKVEDELRRKPGQRIFVKADADLKFGQVYPALIAIHDAGSPGVELGTQEPKEKK